MKKYLPLIVGLFTFSFLEIIFSETFLPRILIYSLLTLALFFLTTLFLVNKVKIFWPVILELFLLEISAILFFILIKENSIFHLLALVFSLLIYFVFKNIYLLFYKIREAKPFFFRDSSNLLNFISGYFFFVGIFALKFFLNFPLPLLLFSVFLAVFWFTFYELWVRKIKINLKFPLVFALLCLEFSLVLSYLPLSFYFVGLFLISFYTIIINLWFAFRQKSILGI